MATKTTKVCVMQPAGKVFKGQLILKGSFGIFKSIKKTRTFL